MSQREVLQTSLGKHQRRVKPIDELEIIFLSADELEIVSLQTSRRSSLPVDEQEIVFLSLYPLSVDELEIVSLCRCAGDRLPLSLQTSWVPSLSADDLEISLYLSFSLDELDIVSLFVEKLKIFVICLQTSQRSSFSVEKLKIFFLSLQKSQRTNFEMN